MVVIRVDMLWFIVYTVRVAKQEHMTKMKQVVVIWIGVLVVGIGSIVYMNAAINQMIR